MEDQRSWIGQNIWVVFGGGGVYLLPEHLLYGAICTTIGLLAFLYPFWSVAQP
jgi:hypothetical protein